MANSVFAQWIMINSSVSNANSNAVLKVSNNWQNRFTLVERNIIEHIPAQGLLLHQINYPVKAIDFVGDIRLSNKARKVMETEVNYTIENFLRNNNTTAYTSSHLQGGNAYHFSDLPSVKSMGFVGRSTVVSARLDDNVSTMGFNSKGNKIVRNTKNGKPSPGEKWR